MAQVIPNLCVCRKVFLKHLVNWIAQDLPWHSLWYADNPVEVLNKHLSLLVGRFAPTKVIRVRNKDKPWFDDQFVRALGLKQEVHHRCNCDCSWVNWEEFVHCQVKANQTYSDA